MYSANWIFWSAQNSYIAAFWLDNEENQVKKSYVDVTAKNKEIKNKKEIALILVFVLSILLLI